MKKNKKGFTLAELLIVVAIIAVLVAIAIPVLNTSLEKSRQAADAANIRSAYAQAVANMMLNDEGGGSSVTAATMKTSSTFDKLTEGETLAGIEFSKLGTVHLKGKYVKVVVTTSRVDFYALDDKDQSITSSTPTAGYDTDTGSVAAATSGSGTGGGSGTGSGSDSGSGSGSGSGSDSGSGSGG